MRTKGCFIMADKKTKNCVHQYVATGEKGLWMVEAISLNKRGKPREIKIKTTVFKCRKCGAKKEYPDTWERNYRMPGQKETRRVAGATSSGA